MAYLSLLVSQNLAEHYQKPYFKYTKSYGPFPDAIYQFLVKNSLNRLPFVFVRSGENITQVKELNLKSKIYSFPDASLALKPESASFAKNYLKKVGIDINKPILGISPSAVIFNKLSEKSQGENHLKLITEIIGKYKSKYQILLLPHSIGDGKNEKICDLAFARKIYEGISNKKNIFFIEDEALTYSQARSIIGELKFYITARFHAVASALYMGTPVVPLSWHVKYSDLMADFIGKPVVIDSAKKTVLQALKEIDKLICDQKWFDKKKAFQAKQKAQKEIRQSVKMIIEGRDKRLVTRD